MSPRPAKASEESRQKSRSLRSQRRKPPTAPVEPEPPPPQPPETTTLAAAKAARTALRQKLGTKTWLKGIGLGMCDEGHCLKVSVFAPQDAKKPPKSFQGVTVVTTVAGKSKARRGA